MTEYNWILGRLRGIDKVAGYSAGSQVVKILNDVMQIQTVTPLWDYYAQITRKSAK